MKLEDCVLIDLPRISDARGNLTIIENNAQIPFSVQRIFYLYDVAENAQRGAHAHHELKQFLVAVSGSFDVILDNGKEKKTVTLASPDQGLCLSPLIWSHLENFSANAVCLVLASAPYDESDYIRDYHHYLQLTESRAHECSVS
jgi:dTDP-4-dehydrorhamnose 3,5-epimerase-like enzyme